MEDPTSTLHAVSSLGGLATIAAGVPLTRYAGRRWVAWPLAALTAVVGGLLVWSAVFGGFWVALPNALLGIAVVFVWDHHVGARHDRPGPIMLRLAAWRIRRGKAGHRRPDGRRLLPIAELRAEYGQNVLDDAARDPHLDHVLAVYEGHLPELIRGPGNELDLLDLTVFANLYLDRLSDPDRSTVPGPPYAGYTHHMLIVAALCRLADRVPTIAVTDQHAAK